MDNKNEVRFGGFEMQDSSSNFDIDSENSAEVEKRRKNAQDAREAGSKVLDLSIDEQARGELTDLTHQGDSDYDSPSQSIKVGADIKTTDRLSRKAVEEIDRAVGTFKRDGDPAAFYNKVRDYMEGNLLNSYDRKIGEEKK